MEQKNNKALIITLIVSLLLVLGLGSYIVYDKILLDNNTNKNNNNNNTNNGNNNTNNLTINDFIGTYSNIEKKYDQGYGGNLTCGKEIILKSDRTFTINIIQDCMSTDTYSGTFSFEDNKLKFNTTHFGDCDISDFMAADGCQEIDAPSLENFKSFLTSPVSNATYSTSIEIIDKNTLKYIWNNISDPDYSGNETLNKK